MRYLAAILTALNLFCGLPTLPAGLLDGFENPAAKDWKKGFFADGAAADFAVSNDVIHTGGYTAKINYTLPEAKSAAEFSRTLELTAIPKQITLLVKADHPLTVSLRLRDANAETFQWTTKYSGNGEWKTLVFPTGELKYATKWGGDKNGEIDLPVRAVALVLTSENAPATGTVYFENLEAADPATAPAKPAAQSSSLPAEVELLQKAQKGAGRPAANTPAAATKPALPATVESPLTPPKDLTDAILPAGVVADWALANAEQSETATRGEIYLNGLWKFRPVWTDDGQELPRDNSAWGYLKVPGGWPASHRWGHNPYAFIPFSAPGWQEVLGKIDPDRGNWHYRNFNLGQEIGFDQVKDAWYERTFTVPAAWQNREIFVNLRDVEQRCKIYVNRRYAGELFWPGGVTNITNLVKFDQVNTLTVRVFTPGIAAGSGPRGLAGDVTLESRGTGTQIVQSTLIPSFRSHNLTAKIAFKDLKPDTQYFVEAKFSLAGQPDKVFHSPVFDPAATTGGEITFVWPWADPVYWDIDAGNCYTMHLTLKTKDGVTVDAGLGQIFGFREFYTEGKYFMLNGRKVHFNGEYYREYGRSFANTSDEAVNDFIKNMRNGGFNLIKFSIYDYNSRLSYYLDSMVRAADRAGMPIMFQLPRIRAQEADFQAWQNWKKTVGTIVRKWYNHPSILFWATDQGTAHYIESLNPANFTGADQYPPTKTDFWNKVKLGTMLTDDYISNLDSSRIVTHLGGGSIGKIISVYPYYGFDEEMEQREHLSAWVKDGSKPLFYAEWGIPWTASFTAHRTNTPHPGERNIPFDTMQPMPMEYSAITLGEKAYDLWPATQKYAAHVDQISQLKEEGRLPRYTHGFFYDNDRNEPVIEQNFITTQAARIRALVPYFRMQELSGTIPFDPQLIAYNPGARPVKDYFLRPTDWTKLQTPGIHPDIGIPGSAFSFNDDYIQKYMHRTPLYDAIKECYAPVYAFVAGPPEHPTAAESNFRPGETVRRTFVGINDTNQTRTIIGKWSLGQLAKGEITLTVPPGEVMRQGWKFDLPNDFTRGQLLLSVDFFADGEALRTDRVAFAVLPPPSPNAQSAYLYDPANLSAAMLNLAQVKFTPVTDPGQLPADAKVLIFGRESVKDQNFPGLAAKVKNGLNLLVLEQTTQTLRDRFGFRTADPAPRQSWQTMSHPALKDIPDNALAFWRGNSTLLEAFPLYYSEFPYGMAPQAMVDFHGFKNKHVWKWGNTNAVASVVIEKPHIGNFRPLAECGFDLQYTPLLEFFDGNGRILFCQYDLSGRTAADPAGLLLANQLVKYLENTPAAKLTGANGLDDDAAKLLNLLHVPADPAGKTVSCGSAEAAVNVGRTTKATQMGKYSNCVFSSANPAFAAINSGDLYCRGELEIPLLPGDSPVLTQIDGKIYFQIRPDLIDDQSKVHLRLTKLKMYRTLRTLLTDQGIRSESPLLDYLEQGGGKNRYPQSYYVNDVLANDDPYRYQHW